MGTLDGITGALGFAGGVGSSGSGGNSAQSSLHQTITPTTTSTSGSGARGSVNIAFPGAHISSTSDINPPLQMKGNAMLLAAVVFVLAIVGLAIFNR